MLEHPSIYTLYRVHPKPDGTTYRQQAGSFYIFNGHFVVLSDPFKSVQDILGPSGDIGPELQKKLFRLENSSYYDLVAEGDEGDIMEGRRLDLVPELPIAEAHGSSIKTPEETFGLKPSVWDYQRVGMDHPQTLEIIGGQAFVNGQAINEEELSTIIVNVQNKVASLRYKQPAPAPVQAEKAEKLARQFEQLAKADPDKLNVTDQDRNSANLAAEDFAHMEDLVRQGHMTPERLQRIRSMAYGDPLTPGMGNKLAYKHFLAHKRPGGVHLMLDANDFKPINEEMGHDVGDKAIGSMGAAIRNALDDTNNTMGGRVPPEGKAHRFGGDEFHVHLPDYQSAAVFGRHLRSRLEAIPPLNGTHHLGMSMGIGTDPAQADQALDTAKKTMKKPALEKLVGRPLGDVERPIDANGRAIRAPGHLFAYSLHPQSPGPVPTGSETPPPGAIPPVSAPKEPKLTPVKMPAQPGQAQPAPKPAPKPVG